MRFMHIVGPLSRLLGSEAPSPPQDSTASPAPAGGNDEHAQAADAARKLEDGETLRKLAGLSETGSGVPPAIERAAQERAAQLIDAGALDFAQLCTPAVNISALLSVSALCKDSARLARAFALIDDPQRLAQLILEGSSSRIRQLAAQKLEDPAELKQVLKQVRGRDKSIYRIIKQKCDVLRTGEQRIAQIETDVMAACASLERHSHRIYDVIYEPSLQHFESRWQTLEAQAAPEMRERAGRAIDRCRQIIAAHRLELEEQAAQKAQHAARKPPGKRTPRGPKRKPSAAMKLRPRPRRWRRRCTRPRRRLASRSSRQRRWRCARWAP